MTTTQSKEIDATCKRFQFVNQIKGDNVCKQYCNALKALSELSLDDVEKFLKLSKTLDLDFVPLDNKIGNAYKEMHAIIETYKIALSKFRDYVHREWEIVSDDAMTGDDLIPILLMFHIYFGFSDDEDSNLSGIIDSIGGTHGEFAHASASIMSGLSKDAQLVCQKGLESLKLEFSDSSNISDPHSKIKAFGSSTLERQTVFPTAVTWLPFVQKESTKNIPQSCNPTAINHKLETANTPKAVKQTWGKISQTYRLWYRRLQILLCSYYDKQTQEVQILQHLKKKSNHK